MQIRPKSHQEVSDMALNLQLIGNLKSQLNSLENIEAFIHAFEKKENRGIKPGN